MRPIKFRAWIKGKMQSTDDLLARGFCPMSLVSVDGDKAIFMQFTGLHDKNGKEIFEGDILFMGDKKPVLVGWSKMFASFIINRVGWMYSHWFGESCDPEDCEVIGNIYENPELLNDKKCKQDK